MIVIWCLCFIILLFVKQELNAFMGVQLHGNIDLFNIIIKLININTLLILYSLYLIKEIQHRNIIPPSCGIYVFYKKFKLVANHGYSEEDIEKSFSREVKYGVIEKQTIQILADIPTKKILAEIKICISDEKTRNIIDEIILGNSPFIYPEQAKLIICNATFLSALSLEVQGTCVGNRL